MHPGLILFLVLLGLGYGAYWLYYNHMTRSFSMRDRVNKKHVDMLEHYKKLVGEYGKFKKEDFRNECHLSEEELDKVYRQATFLSQMCYFGNHIRGPMYGMFSLMD